MQTVNSGMTKRVLTDVLASQYGVEPPANATKEAILGLLENAGCLVTPDENSEKGDKPDTGKEERYLINIFKTKDAKGDVYGCINGKAFVLPRGKDIEVSRAIYEILTKGAIQMIGDPLDGGGVEMYSQQSYPLTLVEVIK